MRRLFAGAALAFACLLIASPAQSKGHDLSSEFTGDRYSGGATAVVQQKTARRAAKRKAKHTVKRAVRTMRGYAQHLSRNPTRDLSGFPEPLVSKVREIESACGSKVISAYRPGSRVRGSGRLSLHSVRKAVDMQGNPACMRSHLVGWRGGASTDYSGIKPNHIHISYEPGGREWGARFAHYSGKRRIRYAHAR